MYHEEDQPIKRNSPNKIILSNKIGFCFGVKRAVRMAEAELGRRRPIYSLGSIIHNRQVVRRLSQKGLKVINSVDKIRKGVVVASSHGISPKIAGDISKRGIKLVDTTCPFVSKAQAIARRLSDEGYDIVIVGDADHPEIKALVDFISGKVFIVKDKFQARALKLKEASKVSIISQTTQSINNFLEAAKAILEKRPRELRVVNTICKDAEERQSLALRLANDVDVVLIIGGSDSANTRRLLDVCKKILKNSYLVETEGDLNRRWFKPGQLVGITSGASTPRWLIEKVVDKLNSFEIKKF